MADEGVFPKVNGDIWYAGDANLIGEFYVEHTDTGGPYSTTSPNTSELVQTYTFSGLDTSWSLVMIVIDNANLSDSTSDSDDYSSLLMNIYDGTDYWYASRSGISRIPSNSPTAYAIPVPDFVQNVGATSTTYAEVIRTQANTTLYNGMTWIPPGIITGNTSIDIRIAIRANEDTPPGNVATLAGGFKIRLYFKKLVQDLGTSTSQA